MSNKKDAWDMLAVACDARLEHRRKEVQSLLDQAAAELGSDAEVTAMRDHYREILAAAGARPTKRDARQVAVARLRMALRKEGK
jgi:hypothetical protein